MMNWKQHVFKPRWQHRNPEIRVQAVAEGREAALLAALSEIAASDEDASVRRAALSRLQSPVRLSELAKSEQDTSNLALINERLRQLCSAHEDPLPPLEEREAVVSQSTDRALLEKVCVMAPEASLRLIAVQRSDRQGLLGDRAIADNDAAVRQAAAAAITQRSTLKRVIGELRTRDKTLYADLQARLHAELLAEGDPAAVREEAMRLCARLDQVAVAESADDSGNHLQEDIAVIQKDWKKLGEKIPPELNNRFNNTVTRLLAANTPAAVEPSPEPVSGHQSPPESTAQPVEQADSAKDKPQEQDTAEPDQQIGKTPEPATKPAPQPDTALASAMQAITAVQAKPVKQLAQKRISQLDRKFRAAWKEIDKPNAADHELLKKARLALKELKAALRDQMEKIADQAAGLMETIEQKLEAGELHEALAVRAKLHQLTQVTGVASLPAALKYQLTGIQSRIREMRDWQHWANNKRRKRLIEHMTQLPGNDLHPDAVLERIKALQKEWKHLDQSEQIPGDKRFHASQGLWRQFQAAGHQAFEALKPFLNKRTEIRDRHLQSDQELSEKMMRVAKSESPDWAELKQLLAEGRKQLRSLDHVPPRARQAMARDLKKGIEALNDCLQGKYDQIEKEKMKLIRAAMQLVHHQDPDAAISEAKALQSRWRDAGSLWRSREQKLWLQFREHLDPLFDKLKSDRDAEQADFKARIAGQKELLTALRTILALDDADLLGQQGKIQGLVDEWSDIPHPDRKIQGSFQKELETVQQRLRKHHQKAARAGRERLWQKADLLHRIEAARSKGKADEALCAEIREAWPVAPENTAEEDQQPERILDQRLEAALGDDSGGTASAATVDDARALCTRLEFLAGINSPTDEKEQRMAYQVKRLAETLSGEKVRQSARDEASDAEQEWLLMPYLVESDYEAFKTRIRAALEEINKE
jgi:hypothetical protein